MEPHPKRRRIGHFDAHSISHPHFRPFQSNAFTPSDHEQGAKKLRDDDRVHKRQRTTTVSGTTSSTTARLQNAVDVLNAATSDVSTSERNAQDDIGALIVSVIQTVTAEAGAIGSAVPGVVSSIPGDVSSGLAAVGSSVAPVTSASNSAIASRTSLPVPFTSSILGKSSSSLSHNVSNTSANMTRTSTLLSGTSLSSEDGSRTQSVLTTASDDTFFLVTTITAHPSHRTTSGSSTYVSTATPVVASSNQPASTPPPAVIAGGVVGGAAGLAVLLFLAMLFLRWYRRRSSMAHHAIDSSSAYGAGPDDHGGVMTENPGHVPLMSSALPALFRHQRKQVTSAPVDNQVYQEPGFVRLSGRKLPSQFSDGAEVGAISYPNIRSSQASPSITPSPSFMAGDRSHRTVSQASYQESLIDPFNDREERTSYVDGPQRRVTISRGGVSHQGTPTLSSRDSMVPLTVHEGSSLHLPATIQTYDHAHPGSSYAGSTVDGLSARGSRFTEEV